MIPHQQGFSKGQRDPRVFYYAPGKCYYTIMMIGGPDRKVRLWKSTNLLDWEHAFDIPNKAAECIDMFEVAVDGDPNNTQWVIADAGTHYEVGEFDGTTWKGFGDTDKDDKRLRFDYGDAWYAAQAFNQAPDGRSVHIGWLRSKQPGYRPFLQANMPFTQQMSIPVEISLRTTPDGIRMFRNPVKEIESLYSKSTKLCDLSVKDANAKLAELTPELIDMTLAFEPFRLTTVPDGTRSVAGLVRLRPSREILGAFAVTEVPERFTVFALLLEVNQQRRQRRHDLLRRNQILVQEVHPIALHAAPEEHRVPSLCFADQTDIRVVGAGAPVRASGHPHDERLTLQAEFFEFDFQLVDDPG